MISTIKKIFFTNRIFETVLKKIGDYAVMRRFYPSNKLYSKPSIRLCENNGVKFKLDISDYQDYLVYFNLKQDSSLPILDFVPESSQNIFDIGANIGQTSLWMANKFKNSAPKIYAFEPFPNTYDRCEANIEMNTFKNIELHNVALGNSEKLLSMIKHSESNSGGYRAHGQYSTTLDTCEVNQTTLDEFWKGNKNKIDFIKIDVEGYEMEVLKGGEKTIRENHPIMVLEVNDQNLKAQNSSAHEMFVFLKENLDYDAFINIQNKKEIKSEDFENCCFDLLVSKTNKS